MIGQIFYSQVLFPHIKYNEKINSLYFLKDVYEEKLWFLRVIFSDNKNDFSLLFIHKDFYSNKHNNSTKNWFIFWENQDLLGIVYSIVNKSDIYDFNFFKTKDFYDLIPFWTVISITSKCNIFCNYCFNDYDYPLNTRNSRKWMSLDDYKKIIDDLYNSWTRDIILTGWEPFVCIFMWDLLDYLKSKNIFIRINTNWTLLSDEVLKRLNDNYVINLMVSIHEFNNLDYFKVNEAWARNIQWLEWVSNFEKKFEKKVEELRKIEKYKNLSLDVMTILNAKNILNLEKIYEFILWNFKVEDWHFFRLYSTWTTKGISRTMISLAIAKLHKLNKLFNRTFKIVDSVPFCATKNTEIARQVIDWELSPHHNVKTIITTDWNVQIMSAFDTNLWSIFENWIEKIWKWKFVQGMLNNWFLPKECHDCKYKEECRWWSRMDWNIYNWSYDAWDPLGDINNKKTNE